jgi:hypothetical protein
VNADDARRHLERVRGRRLRGGCRDCLGHAQVCMDDWGRYWLHIAHQRGCPAAAGIVPWRHVSGQAVEP